VKRVVLKLAVVVLVFLFLGSNMEKNLTGLQNGRLIPCASSPNCVCSEFSDSHFVEPFPYLENIEQSRDKIISIISNDTKAEILSQNSYYIHVVFTTIFMKYKDDVEFRFDDENHVIHVKSASRVGYSDLGKNKSRIDSLRKKYLKQ
jgi:uncharacterized protein (DUF1499 family)